MFAKANVKRTSNWESFVQRNWQIVCVLTNNKYLQDVASEVNRMIEDFEFKPFVQLSSK